MRPGEPPTRETADALFYGLFFDPERYDLSAVGRVKLNMRLGLDAEDTVTTLRKEDILAVVQELVNLKDGKGEIDDIDNLANRRVRSVGELLENQYRVGLLRMERAVKERMSSVDVSTVMPNDLINAKPAVAAVREFFGSSQLSQFMDQTNPLSEVTHKRRVSALGPGGLTRERAGFEVRDVHPTHYGRICPIETPEGPNIGLINSLASFSRVNKYGFIETPYRKVVDGKVTNEVVYLSAMEEAKHTIAQANAELNKDGTFAEDIISARRNGEFLIAPREQITLMDVSPKQLVSVAASLIPFLENDDANRALMGSNMQRQAVPLLQAEAPLVGTGMEETVARDSGAAIAARRSGMVDQVDAARIVVRVTGDLKPGESGVDIYTLMKFQRSNQNTCINQRPLVKVGDTVEAGEIIADGPSTEFGELALGRNVLVAFMPWNGYNYEDFDPDLRADREGRRLHLDPHRGVRGHGPRHQARAGRHHPRHPERRRGSAAQPRRGRHRLYRRRGRAGRHPGRQDHAEGRKPDDAGGKAASRHLRREGFRRARHVAAASAGRLRHGGRGPGLQPPRHRHRRPYARHPDRGEGAAQEGRRRRTGILNRATFSRLKRDAHQAGRDRGSEEHQEGLDIDEAALEATERHEWWKIAVKDDKRQADIEALKAQYDEAVERHQPALRGPGREARARRRAAAGRAQDGQGFRRGEAQLQPGDKMAGRHGNKGVISRILPIEDMPFLEDGTAVDIVLNPLGVPSRMNVGQIFETHLGWASRGIGRQIQEMLEGMHERGKELSGKDDEVLRHQLKDIYGDGYAKEIDAQRRRGHRRPRTRTSTARHPDGNASLRRRPRAETSSAMLDEGRPQSVRAR